MKTSDVHVYGLKEAVKASKYPMQADLDMLNSDVVERTYKLAMAERGSGHDNFLSGILVTMDLTCSLKMWAQVERYHFLQIVSSQSIMHKALALNLDKVFNPFVDGEIKKRCKTLQEIAVRTGAECDKLALIYSLPTGTELTAHISTNYLQLKTIYAQRKNHPLYEWRLFCEMIEQLPYSEFIVGDSNEAEK